VTYQGRDVGAGFKPAPTGNRRLRVTAAMEV